MRQLAWRIGVVAGAAAALLAVQAAIVRSTPDNLYDAAAPPAANVRLDAGYELTRILQAPETVRSLLFDRTAGLFVGTVGNGYVLRYTPGLTLPTEIASGMGDQNRFGACEVANLALAQLDGAGPRELVAATSQVNPRGRPRVYCWTLDAPPTLRGMVRPALQSSWSHGLATIDLGGGRQGVLSAFCGFGEIVEFRFEQARRRSGSSFETLTWRQDTQLAASGELVAAGKLDDGPNAADAADAADALCIGQGFAEGKASLQVFVRTARPAPSDGHRPPAVGAGSLTAGRHLWQRRHVVDEGGPVRQRPLRHRQAGAGQPVVASFAPREDRGDAEAAVDVEEREPDRRSALVDQAELQRPAGRQARRSDGVHRLGPRRAGPPIEGVQPDLQRVRRAAGARIGLRSGPRADADASRPGDLEGGGGGGRQPARHREQVGRLDDAEEDGRRIARVDPKSADLGGRSECDAGGSGRHGGQQRVVAGDQRPSAVGRGPDHPVRTLDVRLETDRRILPAGQGGQPRRRVPGPAARAFVGDFHPLVAEF